MHTRITLGFEGIPLEHLTTIYEDARRIEKRFEENEGELFLQPILNHIGGISGYVVRYAPRGKPQEIYTFSRKDIRSTP